MLIGEVSSPVEMEGNVVIFDDRSMIQLPEGSIMPKVKAGVCICWDLWNLEKMKNTISTMGYHTNSIVPCIQKRSFRIQGKATDPKTCCLTLILFSSSLGQKLDWFKDLPNANKEITFPFAVCIFISFKLNRNFFFLEY